LSGAPKALALENGKLADSQLVHLKLIDLETPEMNSLD
jgi:hypothetical protein